MPSLDRFLGVPFAVARRIDRVTESIGRHGIFTYAGPFCIGVGTGVGLLGLFRPLFLRGIFKRQATMEWMRPSLIAVGASTVAVALIALLTAFIRRRLGDPRTMGELYKLTLARFAFLTGLPLAVVLREPIEGIHASLVLAFASTVGTLVTYSAYHWATRSDAPSNPTRLRRFGAPLACLLYTSDAADE